MPHIGFDRLGLIIYYNVTVRERKYRPWYSRLWHWQMPCSRPLTSH